MVPSVGRDLLEESLCQTFGWSWNDVAGDELSNLGGGSGSRFHGGSNASDVTADDGCHIGSTDIDSLDDFDIGGLGHRVGGFDEGEESLGFNKSNSLLHDD